MLLQCAVDRSRVGERRKRGWNFQFDSTVLVLIITFCDDVGDAAYLRPYGPV